MVTLFEAGKDLLENNSVNNCPSSYKTKIIINKMWHIYKMEYYSAIKRNELELFVVRGVDLESVIQSEVS